MFRERISLASSYFHRSIGFDRFEIGFDKKGPVSGLVDGVWEFASPTAERLKRAMPDIPQSYGVGIVVDAASILMTLQLTSLAMRQVGLEYNAETLPYAKALFGVSFVFTKTVFNFGLHGILDRMQIPQ